MRCIGLLCQILIDTALSQRLGNIASNMSAIEFDTVSKLFSGVEALKPTSFAIESGAFTVLLGPSGCGKSTTLRLIAGLDSPTSGEILIAGQRVTGKSPSERGISMVFQNYALFPHLNVAQNITFGLEVRKNPAPEIAQRLAETAALLGLTPLLARKPGELSGGQQQRVALGRALVSQAKICLMDEPLSNLDAKLRQEMRQELRALQQKLGLTVVYVTHDQTEAMSMGDHVVLMNQGRIEHAASPREIYAKPATTFAARFIGTPPMNLIDCTDGVVNGCTTRLGEFSGERVIGIRPEHISIDTANSPHRVDARVESIEYLGADQIVRCALGSQLISARIPAAQNVAISGNVSLNLDVNQMMHYDAKTLRALPL
jgi:sn-glycerol 3-phosphate transport system ATP-binding protein